MDTFSTPIAQFGDGDGGCYVHPDVQKNLEPIGNHSLENTNRSADKAQNAKYYIRYNKKKAMKKERASSLIGKYAHPNPGRNQGKGGVRGFFSKKECRLL